MASDVAQILSNMLSRNTRSNAQANVPITPANGNPNGAYNMPQQGGQPAMAAPPSVFQYGVSNPSPFMQQIQAMLDAQKLRMQQPAVAQQPVEQQIPQQQVTAPVMPMQQTQAQQSTLQQPQLSANIGSGGAASFILPMRR
ncbi:hypothetical protein [Xanthomonas phage DES1]|nr:hypothetical protein [Xanthomonas phage DES1]